MAAQLKQSTSWTMTKNISQNENNMKNLAKQLALSVFLLAAATSTNVCSISSARAPKAMSLEEYIQSFKDSTTNKPPALAGVPIRTQLWLDEMKRKAFEAKCKMAMQKKEK